MKHSVILICAFALISLTSESPAMATDAQILQARPLQISRRGDTELSCNALSQEAVTMRDIIFTTQDIKDDSKLKRQGISAAGAVGGFLVGTVTGGIGLAAAGFLLDHNIDETAQGADNTQDVAEQRRALMVGIYNAKGCYGPIDHAMQNTPEYNKGEEQRQKNDIHLAAVEPAAGDDENENKYNQ